MDAKRRFLEKVLASGLETGTVTTDDIVSHVNPSVLASELPVPLKAKLVGAALGAKAMDTKLVVNTIGTYDLAEHIPMPVLWACIAECSGRALGDTSEASKGSKAPAAKAPAKAPAASTSKSSPASSSSSSAPSKRAPTAPVEVPKNISGPKPNAKAKGPENGDASKRTPASGSAKSSKSSSRAASGSARSSKSKAAASSSRAAGRSPTSPIVPRSEFDVDTDVGEDWGVDDIVEVVEEDDLVGADDTRLNDWPHDEETVNRDSDLKR